MMLVFSYVLGCLVPDGQDTASADLSFCEEPGDFGRALYTMVEAECQRSIQCGVYTEEEYIMCVSFQSNSTYITQREIACMDWCAVDPWIVQMQATPCGENHTAMVDADDGPIYRCEERNW